MQTLARMEVNWPIVKNQYSLSHDASLMLASDMDRWRLEEHFLWSWMYVVYWAERKAEQRPSLTTTCYACSLLQSNCTLGNRCMTCKYDKVFLLSQDNCNCRYIQGNTCSWPLLAKIVTLYCLIDKMKRMVLLLTPKRSFSVKSPVLEVS